MTDYSSQQNSTYLVTADIPETISNRYGVDLSNEQEKKLRNIQDTYLEKFKQVTPENSTYEIVDGREISEWLNREIQDSETPVASIDDIYSDNADELIDATRLTPEEGEPFLGSRKPDYGLDQQLKEIGENYESIVLSDIGAFTGETINEIGETLENYGTIVEGVLLPIAPKGISSNLEYPVKSMKKYDFQEWLEARDIAKIDGRKAPEDLGKDRPTIFYSENPVEWASIPEDNQEEAKKLMESFQSEIMDSLNTRPEELVGEIK